MPLVSLSASADAFEAFWTSNLPGNDLSLITTNGQPTLIILNAGRFFIEDYLKPQLNDPEFQHYNLIAFELPGWPGTNAPLLRQQADKYDEWVGAALLGDFCLTMNLRDVHFLGVTYWTSRILPRFAALFPSIPRSIAFSSVLADAPLLPDLSEAVGGILDGWTHGSTKEELEEVVRGELYMWFENPPEEDVPGMVDEFITSWRGKRLHASALLMGLAYFTTGMTDAEAALVQCPLLIVQGDLNPFFNAESARHFARHYPNAPSRVHIVAGAPTALSSMPEYAPILHHQVVTHIEATLLSSPTSATPTVVNFPPIGITTDERRAKGMREAMDTCMSVASGSLKAELGARDFQSVLSFSHRSPEQLKEMHERWYDLWLQMEKEECQNMGA